MDNIERAYTTKEVSEFLGIGTSTLRKWCLALEEYGYLFSRTETNKRLYVERDLMALKNFKKLVQGENFSLDNAAKIVTSRDKGEASETRTPHVPPEKEEETVPALIEQRSLECSPEVINKLLNYIEEQNTFMEEQRKYNEELKLELRKTQEKLESTDRYIKERLEERDKALMESLRISQETKKEILQIAAAQEEERKKGFFARLLGR